MRILLVEDDEMIGEGVVDGLKAEGDAVDGGQDGNSALIALRTTPFSLVILDLGLPGKAGLTVLKGARAQKIHLPVLVTTARDTVADRVKGLDAGADDYLVKPFDLDELSARIRALLRRSSGRSEPTVERVSLLIKPETREVFYNGEPILLSSKEYALLVALADRPGVVLSRGQLEEKLTTGIPPWAPTPSKCMCIICAKSSRTAPLRPYAAWVIFLRPSRLRHAQHPRQIGVLSRDGACLGRRRRIGCKDLLQRGGVWGAL